VGISPFLRDFQGGVETVGSLGLAFHGFHAAAISTALWVRPLHASPPAGLDRTAARFPHSAGAQMSRSFTSSTPSS
jgi:hypothetical protein